MDSNDLKKQSSTIWTMGLKEENKELRELLWLRHGCSFFQFYGDDGEMQCHHCMIDFKRDPVEKISRVFAKQGTEILIKHAESLNNEP